MGLNSRGWRELWTFPPPHSAAAQDLAAIHFITSPPWDSLFRFQGWLFGSHLSTTKLAVVGLWSFLPGLILPPALPASLACFPSLSPLPSSL